MENLIFFIKLYPILSFFWICLLIFLIYSFIKKIFSKIKFISHIEAMYQINKKNAIIIDIRIHQEYKKGHIVNSIHLPIQEIQKNNIEKIEKYKDNLIIIVCENGNNSFNVAEKFIKLKFKKVSILKSGFNGWINENLPIKS